MLGTGDGLVPRAAVAVGADGGIAAARGCEGLEVGDAENCEAANFDAHRANGAACAGYVGAEYHSESDADGVAFVA